MKVDDDIAAGAVMKPSCWPIRMPAWLTKAQWRVFRPRAGRRRWEDYTRAKEVMLERTHIAEAPWWVVPAVDKKRARLNCLAHLLEYFPC